MSPQLRIEGKQGRILFLSKRLYMGKDLLSDRYGRFRELPLELSRLGYEVQGISLSYRARDTGIVKDGDVTWTSLNLGKAILPGLLKWRRKSIEIGHGFRPDVVIGASDAFHAIWANRLARRVGAFSVLDLYDNFEAFTGTRVPGIYAAYRRAVHDADLVACISNPLLRLVRERYGRVGETIVLENAVRGDLFKPMDKARARKKLGLPDGIKLIGVAGAISSSRDIETVFRAADRLASTDPGIHIAVAGQRDDGLTWPKDAVTHDLGVLPHDQVPEFIAALDLVIVPNREGAFGSFCQPQKAIEAVACDRPYIAADTGTLAELHASDPGSLYKVGSAESLAENVLARLSASHSSQTAPVWSDIAKQLETAIVRGLAH